MADCGIVFHESYLINLFKLMRHGTYNEKMLNKKKNEILRINKVCEELFSQDYICQLINNYDEILCSHYPPHIVVPYQKLSTDEESRSSFIANNNIVMQYITRSLNARCWNRFAVPTMTYRNKFICRSSTLSGTFEIYGRQYFQSVFGSSGGGNSESGSASFANSDNSNSSGNSGGQARSTGKDAFDQIRGGDKNLLETFKIKYIFDLMLENKKMMFGLPISSSEKVDRHNRYRDFNVISLPYPGCEFFNVWRSSNYQMVGLLFDWDSLEINSSLQLQLSFKPIMTNFIKWEEYRNWDLTVLTTNYLKLMIGIFVEDEYSLLIHCISGWDRTPLFTSLIRCMLWADGFVHQSLSANQLLYLTLAYDWYLFGHQTKVRLEAGEEILKFTFSFLKQIARDFSTSINYVYESQNYAIEKPTLPPNQDSPTHNREILQSKLNLRAERLESLCDLFALSYNQEMSLIVNNSTKKGNKSIMYHVSNYVNNFVINSDQKLSK